MLEHCLTCRKQDPHERILLWLSDLKDCKEFDDATQLDVDDREKQERKTPILPPLKAPPRKQSQSDVAPSQKQSQCNKGDIPPCNKQGQGDSKNLKEMKLALPEKPK